MRRLLDILIRSEVLKTRGFNCYLSRKYIIRDQLDQLRPTIPADDTVGRIAYNVPGKDRMKIRTGRFLTRKLNLNSGFLSDKSIGSIADEINSELFPDADVELVSGSDITEAYRNEVGSSSCMTPSGCGGGHNCTRLYESNPNRFRMLIMRYMRDDARAIVHKLDNGEHYLDRVYASCEMLKDKMRDYAIKKGWHYRLTDDADDYSFSCSAGILVVSGLDYNDGEVPYMDSMINGCTCNGDLGISHNGCCDSELTNTDGSLEGGYSCCNCSDRVSENDTYTHNGEIYCESCFNENYSYCECCQETVCEDDMVLIEDTSQCVCSYCASKYVKCEDCGEYNKENYRIIEDLGYCESCAENYPMCYECGEQSTDSDFINEDGLCEDCRPESEKLPAFVPAESVGQGELKL